ncbi:MAG: response regulator transcription factor [Crocinitomicaceae bacterium]
MAIFEITLLIFSYTLGIVTLFLEFICYRRHIEYKETIFLTVSFLLLIIGITISRFSEFYQQPNWLVSTISISIPVLLVGLSTVFNTFAERNFKPSNLVKSLFISLFVILITLVFVEYFSGYNLYMEHIVMLYLLISVMYSMSIIRTTKPNARVEHREKIERITALVCFIILPVTLFLDLISNQFKVLNAIQSKIGLTLPFLFIFLAGGKLLDDLHRLSLFGNTRTVKDQNTLNYNFSPRELEVVDLLVKGNTYNQIGEALFISVPTVKTHVSNIYKKAQVNNKLELVNLLS